MTEPTDPIYGGYPANSDPSSLSGTKSPLQSKTIISLLTGIVAVLAVAGCKLVISDQEKESIAEGVGAVVVLASMVSAWVGRVRATRQIGTPSRGVDALLLLLPLLVFAAPVCSAGCQPVPSAGGTTRPAPRSARDRVYEARQARTVAMNVLTPLIESDVIKDVATLSLIQRLNDEVGADLDLAEQHADDPTLSSFESVMTRVKANLLRLQAEADKRKSAALRSLPCLTHSPSPLYLAWCRPGSPPSTASPA